jgi:predicted naringenin-chalcone synthase
MVRPPLLTGFALARPEFEAPQETLLDWLADAHAASEAALGRIGSDERAAFAGRLRRVLRRCGCPPEKIARRGFSFAGPRGGRWQDDAIYDLGGHAHGGGTRARSDRFAALVGAYFERAYPHDRVPPDDLVHVTCTGYVSPSPAQRLVATRGWGERTRVTHAYHMGCYAALPALRLAGDMVGSGRARVDVVHTELCSLHLDPTCHSVEQLVVQSLFADGYARYSVVADDGGRAGLRGLAAHEVILPDSAGAMTWVVGEHGMQMSLARDVPERVAAAARGFVIELYRRAGIDVAHTRSSVFAVHPGGPKIIDRVREVLELREPQVAASRAVLHDFGNMSSATLPHIWARVLDDPGVAPGTLVASLAFGPGLTVCGALLEKRAGRPRR